MSPGRRGRGPAVVAAAAGFLAVQLAVPASYVGASAPHRFAWQMYSVAPPAPSVAVLEADGTRRPLPVQRFFAFHRGDLTPEYVDRLPAHVCRVTPGAVAVELRRTATAPLEVTPCR